MRGYIVQHMACVGTLILLAGMIPAFGSAEVQEPENILIRNVRLIDRSGEAEDRSIDILTHS